MINLYNFDNCKESGLNYGGHDGKKRGIIYNDERWFLKFPKNTKSMDNVKISYTTTPLSEFLGSQIYKLLNIDVHETVLGISQGKLVVACKDFLNYGEKIEDYTMLKNYETLDISEELESLSSSTIKNKNDMDELNLMFEKNPYFIKTPKLKKRFWDMFVIDALIGNSDRNEGNWGIIVDTKTLESRICPVFDNGASFYNKHSDEKMQDLLEDEDKFINSAYHNLESSFVKNDKIINPLKYMESMEDVNCNEAFKRIVPSIDLEKIDALIDNIPETYQNIEVFSSTRKKFYKEILKYRYEKVMYPTYQKLIAISKK